jgi:hypothetical protein
MIFGKDTTPLGATTICLAWPMLSANTVAQKPCGSVIPPSLPAQGCEAGAAVWRPLCAADGETTSSNVPSM